MPSVAFYSLNLEDGGVNARFGGMYRSFFRALQAKGVRVTYHSLGQRILEDVVVLPMGGGQEYRSLAALRDYFGAVVLYVPPASEWFDAAVLSCLRPIVLFAYGTDASSASVAAYGGIGIDYLCLPFASDPTVMRPLDLLPSYDVAFVGSAGHAPRRAEFLAPLLRAFPPGRVLVVGSGWESFGIAEQQLEWGSLLNIVYNLAAVCVNVHGDEQVRGRDRQTDANNRLFDLAMAGRCQVSDNQTLVRDYFSPDEVATANEPQAWVQRVVELVAKPEAATEYGTRARSRALDSHTWDERAGAFVAHMNRRLVGWCAAKRGRPTIGPVLRARIAADHFQRRASRTKGGLGG